MSSHYPNGFSKGVVIKGVPLEIPHPGKVYWVNNSGVLPDKGIGASDGNDGSYLRPFSTIDYAIGRCTADRGDVIYVMPGHSETVAAAAGIDLDVAGVSLVGLGRGSKMCKIDFTATGSTVEVNADDVSIYNMKFHANVSAVAIGLSVLTLATDCLVKDCVFDVETAGTDEFLIAVNAGVGCDRLMVEGCTINMGIAGAAAGVKLVGASDDVGIKSCRVLGDYSLAPVSGITVASTNVLIQGNILENGIGGNLNAQPCIELLTATTGTIADNYMVCNVASAAASTVSDTCLHFQNKYNETVDTTGTNLEVADA